MFFENKKLREIIDKNPKLPIVFSCSGELAPDDYYKNTVANNMFIKVGKIMEEPYGSEDVIYDDKDDLREAISDDICCVDDNANKLTDEEFEKRVDEEFNKYKWKKAIIIQLS